MTTITITITTDERHTARGVGADASETHRFASIETVGDVSADVPTGNALDVTFAPQEDYEQLSLFDADEYFASGPIDPFAGWSLVDVRALAMDPHHENRLAAASSRWNWDTRLQQVLATDPDERVVLALLDHTDPSYEICEQIIAGPHTAARRQLASRNVSIELLERLAHDPDLLTRGTAINTLAGRSGQQSDGKDITS